MSSGRHKRDDSQSSYYFIQSPTMSSTGAVLRDDLPLGSTASQFSPRTIRQRKQHQPAPSTLPQNNTNHRQRGLLGRIFGGRRRNAITDSSDSNLYVGARKVDPKIFFSIERTFLAWMHTSLIVAAIAFGVVNFADENPTIQLYGLVLNLLAIVFIIFAIFQCKRKI